MNFSLPFRINLIPLSITKTVKRYADVNIHYYYFFFPYRGNFKALLCLTTAKDKELIKY